MRPKCKFSNEIEKKMPLQTDLRARQLCVFIALVERVCVVCLFIILLWLLRLFTSSIKQRMQICAHYY